METSGRRQVVVVGQELRAQVVGKGNVDGVGGGHVVPVGPGVTEEWVHAYPPQAPVTQSGEGRRSLGLANPGFTTSWRRSTATTSA